MAYHTIEDGPWPKGTTVAAWPAANVVGGVPSGAAIASGVASANGVVELGGLTEGAMYTALGHGGSQTFEAINQEARLTALEVVQEAPINVRSSEFAALAVGGDWGPALKAAGLKATTGRETNVGAAVYVPYGLYPYSTLEWYGDVHYHGDGINATQLTQLSGTADVLAKPARDQAEQRLQLSQMTLTAFTNQAANTGGLNLFRLTKSVLDRAKVSYFKNYGIRTKGGADPLTGDSMRNEFQSCEIANGQAGSYGYLGTSGSDVAGATNGGGHPDGTLFYGGLITGSSMAAAWRVDAPPSNGAVVYAQDCLIVFGTQVQSVPVIFDLQGGWGHRFIGCRWENTDGVMSLTAGAGSALHPVDDIGLIGCSMFAAGNIVTITDTNGAIWHIGTLDGSSRKHFQVPQGLKFTRLTAPWDNDSLWRDTGDRLRWYDHAGGSPVVVMCKVTSLSSANSPYTVGNSDWLLKCDTAGGNILLNLPAASTQNGKMYMVKRISAGANTLTIDPNGAETIDGAATLALATQWDSVTIFSDGASWFTQK